MGDTDFDPDLDTDTDTGGDTGGGIASRLGLGLAAIGRPAYITVGRDSDLGSADDRSIDAMQDRAHRLLEEAWLLGVRYFDAARSYGHAERFLGSWLAEHPARRDALTIGSKWGYEYVGDWRLDADVQERKDHGLRMLEQQWPETLEALGGAPDVYLIHSLTPESPALDDPALLDRLREIAASGVRVGFSTSGPEQAAVIDRVLALADSPFTAVQSTWNLLEPSAGPALARANDARWLVVVKEVLANGRLTARGAEVAQSAGLPAGGTGGGVAARGAEVAAAALAAASGQPLAGLAIGAAVAHPWADIVLSGAVTGEQLRENLAARPPGVDLDEDALAALAEPPGQYWAARSARPWT
ncbi:aldo/keto reductase [Subtercola boreus]|uniref:Aldo/keto reductase n=1 Tax=Subtercola boreus TaxID=120213 RepID=A0A3E0WA75_9MICO|nr:aldo/keto reductase [Subtercola boreus]RFA18277.1 aldo/keto reductase [Subtercola boreus]RFA18669.1 aldo/keto reductase [Subtercola boreus]RFA25272.1 aldo/keto reductase [Subtercola boreus]